MSLHTEDNSKALAVHFQIDSERAVRDAFARYHVELGFPKILVSQEAFPDYVLEGSSGSKIRAEAEFRSSGYNHPLDGCDLVICWEVDRKLPIRTLELCRWIELPHYFEGFDEGELDNLSEYARTYSSIANKSKGLLRELAALIKRRDHSSTCSNLYPLTEFYDEPVVATAYAMQIGREGWEVQPVLLTVNLLKEELSIEGRFFSYLPKFKEINLEKWRALLHEAREKGLTLAQRAYSGSGGAEEISTDAFSQSLPDPNEIWCIALTRKNDVTSLYQKRDLLLDSLISTVALLLDIISNVGLYGH